MKRHTVFRIAAFLCAFLFVLSAASCMESYQSTTDVDTVDLKEGKTGEHCKWSLDLSSKTMTISGKGAMKEATISGNNSHAWEDYRYSIEKLIVEEGVTKVTRYAFRYCTNLKSAELPDSLTSIEDEAFQNCTSLESIYIPDNVTYIGKSAFKDCEKLSEVHIPANLKYIYDNSFAGCKLDEITVPIRCKTEKSSYYGDNKDYGVKIIKE